MKVLVLTSHVDRKGTVSYAALVLFCTFSELVNSQDSYGSHEFGEEEDQKTFAETYPNWETEEGFMRHWSRYCESYLGE